LVDVFLADGGSLGPSYGVGPNWVTIQETDSTNEKVFVSRGTGKGSVATSMDVYFENTGTCSTSFTGYVAFVADDIAPGFALRSDDRLFKVRLGETYSNRAALSVLRTATGVCESSPAGGPFNGIRVDEVSLPLNVGAPLQVVPRAQ
jgi:hypothetical protein